MKQTNLQIMKWSLQTTTSTDGFRKSRQTAVRHIRVNRGAHFEQKVLWSTIAYNIRVTSAALKAA